MFPLLRLLCSWDCWLPANRDGHHHKRRVETNRQTRVQGRAHTRKKRDGKIIQYDYMNTTLPSVIRTAIKAKNASKMYSIHGQNWQDSAVLQIYKCVASSKQEDGLATEEMHAGKFTPKMTFTCLWSDSYWFKSHYGAYVTSGKKIYLSPQSEYTWGLTCM